MPLFDSILIGFFALYGLTAFWILVYHRRRRYPATLPDPVPYVSVVVAARNEAACIRACINALVKQDYPSDRFEIWIANDQSTDATAELVREAMHQHPFLHLIDVPSPNTSLRGKALALHTAIEQARGDLILITDADCTPPPIWAARMASYFTDPKLGMVCGVTVVESETILQQVQTLDWMYLMSFAATMAEAGGPITAMGNNMALRRSVYMDLGGYPALPFSVTEDFTLFQAVHQSAHHAARLSFDPALMNQTRPLNRFAQVFKQRKRWSLGGLHASFWVWCIYGWIILSHALLLIGLVLTPLLALSVLLFKIFADGLVVGVGLNWFGRRVPWRALLPFEAYLFFYILAVPVALLWAPTVQWKERVY